MELDFSNASCYKHIICLNNLLYNFSLKLLKIVTS